MISDKYENLLMSIYGLIDPSCLAKSVKIESPRKRVDTVQDLLRDAISRYAIGKHNGLPCFFNGRTYEVMGNDRFGNLIYDLMRKCGLPMGDYSRIDSIIRVCHRAISCKSYEPDMSVVVFRNCVLDTKDRSVHPFSASFVQMNSIGYDYVPDCIPLQWDQFLSSVLPEKEERVTLQESLGCLLLNRSDYDMGHITFLHGTGSNGKSVVHDTVLGLFGGNVTRYPLSALIGGRERKNKIASMYGKYANYSPEYQKVDISKFIDEVMDYEIPLQFVHVNNYPDTQDLGSSVKKKVVVVNFNVEIPPHKQDRHLAKVFESEYSGILNWIMDGRDRFVDNGYQFTHRESIDHRLDEYKYECNSVLKFMTRMKYYHADRNMVDAYPRYVSSTILYRKYCKWCVSNDIVPENKQVYGRMLTGGGYTKRRLSGGMYYALYGKAVLDQIAYKNVSGQRQTNREKNVPFMQDGRKYVISYRGLSDEINVTFNTISSWMKLGLMEGTYMKAGSRFLFDVDKVVEKIKASDILKSDIERDKANQLRVKGEIRRGGINTTMKKYGSGKRVYKSPVIDAIRTDQAFLSQKEIDRMVDG